mmetsp:Transcript_49125/g.122033  ORF Transcript_49125/g.122033 Transcript_49125/m.122033 type:complete len:231 (+) Transcript_49125:484-1176(+)
MIFSTGRPSNAISWIRLKSGNWSATPLALRTVMTSLHVMVPCSFCPLSLAASISSQVPSFLAKASAHLRLRPPKHVVTRSARPQLSMKVSSLMPEKNILANLEVSFKPIRMMAAFVFPPSSSPSQKPAPKATTFLSAPQSSTPATSLMLPTRNVGQSSIAWNASPLDLILYPTVDSQNSSRATSLATLAPISTETSMPFISSLIMSEIRSGPVSLNSIPLISESARQPLA